MNKLTIIGNLVRDPETRTVGSDHTVCSFTVAVNRRPTTRNPNPEADFFRVSCWDKLGENCQRFLAKGKKVAVVGPVSVSVYTPEGKEPRATLEVRADDVEFLSSREQSDAAEPPAKKPAPDGFQEVDDLDESLPF